jgi:uncharacterized protein YecT (DUF1311 family)
VKLSQLLSAALLLSMPSLVHAKSPDLSNEQRTLMGCIKGARGQSVQVAKCYAAAQQSAGRRMDAAYSRLKAGLSKQQVARLLESQRRWIEFRDADHGFSASLLPEFGTSETTEHLQDAVLRYELVRARADELEWWLSIQEPPAASPR